MLNSKLDTVISNSTKLGMGGAKKIRIKLSVVKNYRGAMRYRLPKILVK